MPLRTSALALTLMVAILACAPSAVGQDRAAAGGTPTPSASRLWQKYPLHPTPTATETVGAGDATQVAERTKTRSPAVRSSDDGSSWSPMLIALIVVVGIAAAGVWTLVFLRRSRGPLVAGGRRHSALPPDPARRWTGAIDWIQEGDGAHFRVVARAQNEPGATPILRSAVLPWPPADSGAVDAMTKAVERLELRLLDAGWTPTEPGRAWYEKRFAWAPRPTAVPPPQPKPKRPVPPKPAPKPKPAAKAKSAANAKAKPVAEPKPVTKAKPAAPKSGRERPPEAVRRPTPARGTGSAGAATASRPAAKRTAAWPPDAEDLWRCEIRFDAGYTASRFSATVHPPVGSDARSRVVARSESLRWLFMNPPDAKVPEHRNAAVALARALRDAGWEVVGRGGGWYAEHYVWRGEGDPPEHVDVPVANERGGERP